MSQESAKTRRPTEHDRGLAEGARLWALEQGLPVAARGEVPWPIVDRYRKLTNPN
jgi:hypothetical protein